MLLTATMLFLLSQSTPQVVFESELWPGEGRPVFAAVGGRLPLRDSPDQSGNVVATWAGRPGQVLEFDDTRYRTIRRTLINLSTDSDQVQLGFPT